MKTYDFLETSNNVEEPQVEFVFAAKKPILEEKKDFKIVSLFSGCGGLDLGFNGNFSFRNHFYKKNNFKISYSNDIDAAAELVYNANKSFFDKHSLVKDDVKNIDLKKIPDFDFLLAGFPCQPFSNAGLRKGINDDRGNLFEECEKLLSEGLSRTHKPLGFVFENVKGIMSSKMPDGTSIPDEIVKRTEKLGFKVNYKLLKTSDYGVPSNRQRLIIVGIRDDFDYFNFNLLDEVVYENKLPNEKNSPYELLLGSILSDIPENAPQKADIWAYSPGGQYMVDKIGSCLDGAEALPKFKKKTPINEISTTINKGRSWKNMNPADMSERFLKIWNDPKKYHAPNFYRRFALG